MTFGDVKTEAGLKALNEHLLNASFVEGYAPSKADSTVLAAVGKEPCSKKYPNAARWYRHIKSFSAAESKAWPNSKKAAEDFLKAGATNGVAEEEDDDDDVDMFGSDDEEESAAAAKLREERLAAYAEKKSKKPALIAKTSVVLDVKPWDDETDMEELLKCVKGIEMEGLVWGAAQLKPVGYGINKYSIMCVVEDLKVSIDELQEKIQDFEDYVQSCDVAAMNKI